MYRCTQRYTILVGNPRNRISKAEARLISPLSIHIALLLPGGDVEGDGGGDDGGSGSGSRWKGEQDMLCFL